MDKELTAHLQALGAAFQTATDRSQTAIWREAARDAWFLKRIERGGSFTVKMYDRVTQWFSDNWPDATAWPDGVPRPSNETEAA